MKGVSTIVTESCLKVLGGQTPLIPTPSRREDISPYPFMDTLKPQSNGPLYSNTVQGLKFLQKKHTERDDRVAESPERGTEARSAGVPRGWGLGRGAEAPPQYGVLGAFPAENFEI